MCLNTNELLDSTATISTKKLIESWGIFTPFGAHTPKISRRIDDFRLKNNLPTKSNNMYRTLCNYLLYLVAIPVDISYALLYKFRYQSGKTCL